MFVSFNQLAVPQAEQEEMLEVFRRHSASMRQVPGCLSFELWQDGDTLVSVSHWDSKSARDNYLRSDAFRAHHPRGDGESQRPRRPSKISQFKVEKLL